MAEENPALASMPWYRGLSRYQWWVLIIASMGWMFDTMDQHFFTLARSPAMQDMLDYDPVERGLEKLEPQARSRYTAADLTQLVAEGLLTEVQRANLLVGPGGRPIEEVSRKRVAEVIGLELLAPTFQELGHQKLKELNIHETVFDAAGVQKLVDQNAISPETARTRFQAAEGVTWSREEVTLFIGREVAKARADAAGDRTTMIFVMGWAIGGLLFGWIGDSLGRAKTMALTILTYSVFTGLNGFAQTEFQFDVLRFLTALGIGGEFAAGAALVAEAMPDRSRPAALGTLQALSAVGNMLASIIAFFVLPTLGWRWLFLIGALPGVVAVFVFLTLDEPQRWREARAKWLADKAAGVKVKRASYLGLFENPRWLKRAVIGLLLGVVGVGGLWGVAFFTPELNRLIGAKYGFSQDQKDRFVALAFFFQQAGAFAGISAYTVLALRMGRRPAFAIFFILAFLVVSYTFLAADTLLEAYILAPLVGFVTLGPFGGYAIYFPELFPTRLRATGVGFCYNVGRFLAALVPSIKSGLKGLFMSGSLALPFLASATGNAELAIRYGSFLMIFIYLVGLVVLLFAPETKGQPLPEE